MGARLGDRVLESRRVRRAVARGSGAGAIPNRAHRRARYPRFVRRRMSAARTLPALAGALLLWALFFGGGNGSDPLVWIGGAALVVAAIAGAAVLMGRLPRPSLGPLGLAF